MEWIDRLNRAVDYLEEHLKDPDLQEAARIACCSPYHFQRMFTLLAGMPLSEYLRRRRMSRAAVDLQSGADTPTTRNGPLFSMRYSISSTPCTVMAKRSGGWLFSRAPGRFAWDGGSPWTVWKDRLKAVGEL